MKNRGICLLRHDLFIRTVDGSGLESATANQWPRGRERILNDKLNPTSPQWQIGVGMQEINWNQ